jgi:hypothetical protein
MVSRSPTASAGGCLVGRAGMVVGRVGSASSLQPTPGVRGGVGGHMLGVGPR